MPRALVTGLAEKRRAYLEERRLRRAVRIVTIGAVLRDRLVLPQERAAVFGVAARAGFRDGVLDELRRCRRAVRRMARGAGHLPFVQRVTTRACDVARGVRARCPVARRIRLVAGQALCILLERRRQRFGAKVDHACERSASGLHVRAARSMARLALKSAVAEGPVRVIRLCVLGTEDPRDRRIVMAAE